MLRASPFFRRPGDREIGVRSAPKLEASTEPGWSGAWTVSYVWDTSQGLRLRGEWHVTGGQGAGRWGGFQGLEGSYAALRIEMGWARGPRG